MGKRKDTEKNGNGPSKRHKSYTMIEPGWQGVFVTCPRGKETTCRAEFVELAGELVEKLWPQTAVADEEHTGDIEEQIRNEIAALNKKKKGGLIDGHLIGCECVIFVRTKKPIDPVRLVVEICKSYLDTKMKRTRYVQRMTPVSLTVPASLENLELVEGLIAEAFAEKGQKFAIRPTIRNNNQILRDDLISSVARLVGPDQSVNLKNYDKLILVECFKSILGISVVGPVFDEYARFNLMQLHENHLAQEAAADADKSKS